MGMDTLLTANGPVNVSRRPESREYVLKCWAEQSQGYNPELQVTPNHVYMGSYLWLGTGGKSS